MGWIRKWWDNRFSYVCTFVLLRTLGFNAWKRVVTVVIIQTNTESSTKVYVRVILRSYCIKTSNQYYHYCIVIYSKLTSLLAPDFWTCDIGYIVFPTSSPGMDKRIFNIIHKKMKYCLWGITFRCYEHWIFSIWSILFVRWLIVFSFHKGIRKIIEYW